MRDRSDAADIAVIVAVARARSFTRAAEALGTSKSNVGKAVRRVEGRLGARLFQRTTRAVQLTEDGETYLRAAELALDGLREAERAIASRRAEPSGQVRLGLPAGFAHVVFPALGALRQRHPKLTFELDLSDRFSDPVAEGLDLVIRIGPLPTESGMAVRKLGALRLGLYAAPAYLSRRGRPRALSDLDEHDAIVFRGPTGRLRAWTVLDEGAARELAPPRTFVVADGRAVVDAAVLGLGIAQIHDVVAAPPVASGVLERVLPKSSVGGTPLHALVPLGPRMPPKTRAVLNLLVQTFQSAR